MKGTGASRAAARGPKWSCLPDGVLQQVLGLASTWQRPGSCLGSRVCSSWRAAAAGCSNIRLLYNGGHAASDESFAAWLGSNSQQLSSLILVSSGHNATEQVLVALAEAAEAAVAGTGRPLQLNTLRVLGCGPSWAVVGRLAASLPQLRCLQLPDPNFNTLRLTPAEASCKMQEELAPLQHASQLEELHLPYNYGLTGYQGGVAELLPPNLERLSWGTTFDADGFPNLSHLSRLTSLQLGTLHGGALPSSHLPPGLQELGINHLEHARIGFVTSPTPPLQQMTAEQRQLVTSVGWRRLKIHGLGNLPKLQAMSLQAEKLCGPGVSAAVAQLTCLSALSVDASGNWSMYPRATPATLQGVLSTAASIQGLRRLSIQLGGGMARMPGLSRLTMLTRLAVSTGDPPGTVQQQREWAEELGRMPRLRWLSVPHVLLRLHGCPWLSTLTQLQVLQVSVGVYHGRYFAPSKRSQQSLKRRVHQVLEGDCLRAAPPQLSLLLMTGVTPEEAALWRLRRSLRQQLAGTSGCEVVVAVEDPTQLLVGLPEGLQGVLE